MTAPELPPVEGLPEQEGPAEIDSVMGMLGKLMTGPLAPTENPEHIQLGRHRSFDLRDDDELTF